MRERIEQALAQVRPSVRMDGGDVQLVDVTDEGIVQLRLTGACGSCLMSQMTLKLSVETTLKTEVPEVKGVEAV